MIADRASPNVVGVMDTVVIDTEPMRPGFAAAGMEAMSTNERDIMS
jgi:hypothetical protein